MNFVPAGKYLSLVCALAALAAIGASPASSKTARSTTTQSSQQLYLSAPEGGTAVMDKAREQAIHDCSVEANKWSMSSWQNNQLMTYGACMAEHGQPQ